MMYYPSRLESWPTPLSANCKNLKLCSTCYSFFHEHFILLVSSTKNQPDGGTTHRCGHFLEIVSICVVLFDGLSFSFIVEVKFLAYTYVIYIDLIVYINILHFLLCTVLLGSKFNGCFSSSACVELITFCILEWLRYFHCVTSF
jgi:hypothetical protein